MRLDDDRVVFEAGAGRVTVGDRGLGKVDTGREYLLLVHRVFDRWNRYSISENTTDKDIGQLLMGAAGKERYDAIFRGRVGTEVEADG